MAIDCQRAQGQGDLIRTGTFGHRNLGRRTLGNGDVPILVLDIIGDGNRISLSHRPGIGLNGLVSADFDFSPGAHD